MARERQLYLARLAEQAERYDEMAAHMEAVARLPDGLSAEERNLLSVAYKNAVGSRRAAWRAVASMEQKGKTKEQAGSAKEYRDKVEAELEKICKSILELLDGSLIAKASTSEDRVFYQKMKADYYRYIAEFSEGLAKRQAAENACLAYEEGKQLAERDLAVTDPIRLACALNYSVFLDQVMGNPEGAGKVANAAFEDALAELENLAEEDPSYKDTTLIMQLLRDMRLLRNGFRAYGP